MRFKLDQRVSRDMHDSKLEKIPIREGTIVRVYGRVAWQVSPDFVLGPYPELYDVQWDDGGEGTYLPHGIDCHE